MIPFFLLQFTKHQTSSDRLSKRLFEWTVRDFRADQAQKGEGVLCVRQALHRAELCGKIHCSIGKDFGMTRPKTKTAHRRLDVRISNPHLSFAAGFGTLVFTPGCRVSSGRSLHRS